MDQDLIFRKINSNIIGINPESNVYKTTRERIVRYAGRMDLTGEFKEDLKTSAADMYFLYYSNLAYVSSNENKSPFLEGVRKKLASYVQSDEFSKFRAYSKLNDRVSMIYSINFLKALNEESKKERQKNGDSTGKSASEMVDRAMKESMQRTEKARQLEKLMRNEIPGGRRSGNDDTDIDRLIDLSERMMSVQNADKIITTANKLIDIMPKFTRKMRARSTSGELGGYYKTRNLSNVLSRELAMPDEVFYSKILYGFTGKEKVILNEGAYYVLLDKSGSMYEADKMVWSRSVALALFRLSAIKHRKYFFRFFDNKPHEMYTRPYDIVNNILTVEASKGTCIECAILRAIDDIKNSKIHDLTSTIIVITDGEDKVNIMNIASALAKTSIKIITVMINGYNEGLKKISEKYLNAVLTEQGALNLLNIAKSF
ncbi:VWA domain-containing protein [Acidiplasma sp.]|uniref:vWA domain-containing protein n=1 Tax=Acidiplasma sp. TaxID=1872114 RepID=UPI002589F404|nr:VWA domain-containing protein [Acidiplasma sp.]